MTGAESSVDYGKMKFKKAQMKIQQMAFMIIAVTIFFVLAGMFALLIIFSGIRESAALAEETQALALVSRLANSPEFSCGTSFGTRKVNCVDADKIFALSEKYINEYEDFWDFSLIEVETIHPPEKREIVCNSTNYPDCGKIVVLDRTDIYRGIPAENFVALCRKEGAPGIPVQEVCHLAKLRVYYRGD